MFKNINQISFSPSFKRGLLPAIETQYRCLAVASYIRAPTDLAPAFSLTPCHTHLVFFMLCVPATLAFSLLLKCTKIAILAFLPPGTLFPLVFSWWIPAFQSQSYVASSEKSSQNTQPSIACAPTCDHCYIIEYSSCHLSLSEIILFVFFTVFFSIALIKI